MGDTAVRPRLSAFRRVMLCMNVSFSILLNIASVEAIVIPLPSIQRTLGK